MHYFKSHNFISYILPFFGGLLYAWGFPVKDFFHFFLFPILGMAFLLNGISPQSEENQLEKRLKSRIISVFSFSLGYCLLGYYWIPDTLKEFGSIPAPFNYILGLLFSLILTPHLVIFVLTLHLSEKFKFSSYFLSKNTSMQNATLAITLTLLEYYTPQQFPAHMGHPWLQLAPYLGLAPFAGAPLFSFISFWCSLSIVSKFKIGRWDKWSIVVLTVFIILNFSFPLRSSSSPHPHPLNMRLVQANIGNFLKINSESGNGSAIGQVINSYKTLSLAPSEKPLDLIIWPETAYPLLLSSSHMKINQEFIPNIFKETILKTGAEFIVGGYDRAGRGNADFFETEYNTVFHFNKKGKLLNFYHKQILIPFGEGLPFGRFNKYFAKVIKNISFFAKGDDYTLFQVKKKINFISAICYEILFSSYIRNYLNKHEDTPFHFILNLTNDSWYGNSSELWQHKFLAHWRSLEFQLPIFRVTNTGITSVLFPDGSESRALFNGEVKNLDLSLKLDNRRSTTFQRLGIALTLCIFMLLITLMGIVQYIDRIIKSKAIQN